MKYSDAGVDISKAERAMGSIKGMVKSTFTPEVCADFGNFGGLFSIGGLNMEDPILVASIDGVGTKVKIAIEMEKFNFPGMDIVNHCVDDILVQGARPLFFMDYYATAVLEERALVGVVQGLTDACRENGCALLGGETAEMPGLYKKGDFDLAGSIVGVVDRKNLIDGSAIKPGDLLIGLDSSGLHTNGYSLARKVLQETAGFKLTDRPEGLPRSVGDELVEPHRPYLKPLYPLVLKNAIRGMAHITGGGFQGNIPRILPEGVDVEINRTSWKVPAIFRLIQSCGNVEPDEMYHTFNMGIGMVCIVSPENAPQAMSDIASGGVTSRIIGKVTEGKGGERVRFVD